MIRKSVIILALSLNACGPIYQTDYSFTPPKSTAGKYCVQNCEEFQDLCEKNMTSGKENCEADNQRLIDDCNERIAAEKNRGPKITECGRQIACDFPVSRCDTEYRSCYQNCGGTVHEEKVCIANCDQVKK